MLRIIGTGVDGLQGSLHGRLLTPLSLWLGSIVARPDLLK